jgi:hypothetical protein
MKPTTGSHTRPAATSRATPIHALGVAGEGPRPSDPQRPITCECGCGLSMTGKRPGARYATDACRSRAWKTRNDYRLKAVRTRVRHGKSGPSGLQLPYARMVRALIAEFRDLNLPNAEARAVEMVRRELSDRQRARLDERGTG